MAVLSWWVPLISLLSFIRPLYKINKANIRALGGLICQLNCDNERDLNLLNSPADSGRSLAS